MQIGRFLWAHCTSAGCFHAASWKPCHGISYSYGMTHSRGMKRLSKNVRQQLLKHNKLSYDFSRNAFKNTSKISSCFFFFFFLSLHANSWHQLLHYLIPGRQVSPHWFKFSAAQPFFYEEKSLMLSSEFPPSSQRNNSLEEHDSDLHCEDLYTHC